MAIMYELISARLSPNNARALARASMKLAAMIMVNEVPTALRRTVMDLSFPSPVGLAAGFDKHGALYPSLPSLGFGFAEIGSSILLPEQGRSEGIDVIEKFLARYRHVHPIPLGISISMNRKTPFSAMAEDYVACIQRLWKYADYLALNLGVRAGPDLHLTENRTTLLSVLASAKEEQTRIAIEHGVHCPLVIKVDQTRGESRSLLDCVKEFSFDGLILGGELGKGDSWAALKNLERVVKIVDVPVISVGGISTPQDVLDRLSAGAKLVQLYSGLVQSGPLLMLRINAHLAGH